MGWKDTLSKAADKVSHTVSQNREKIEQSVDKGADFARNKTGGKHDDKIRKGTERLRSGLDKVSSGDRSPESSTGDASARDASAKGASAPTSTSPPATPSDRPGDTPPAAPNRPV